MASIQENNHLQQLKTFTMNAASFAAGSLWTNITLAYAGIGCVGNFPSIISVIGAVYYSNGASERDSLKDAAIYGIATSTAFQLGGCLAGWPASLPDADPLSLNKTFFLAGLCLLPLIMKGENNEPRLFKVIDTACDKIGSEIQTASTWCSKTATHCSKVVSDLFLTKEEKTLHENLQAIPDFKITSRI